MNRRVAYLLIVLALTAFLGVQAALAQNNANPQAVVSVELAVLRDAPSNAGNFVASLPQSTQVTLLDVDNSGRWFQVETADGKLGWGQTLHFAPLSRARALRTLVLFEAPNDNINYVTGVEGNAQVLILQTDETGAWTRVLAPDGQSGWTETALLRFDYGLVTREGTVLLNWPDHERGVQLATLNALTPVFIEDVLGDWVRVRTSNGQSGWAEASAFNTTNTVTLGVVTLVEGEGAILRAGPAIDTTPQGTLGNGAIVQIAGRSSDNRWLMVATGSGQIAWISSGLVTFEGGLGSLVVLTP